MAFRREALAKSLKTKRLEARLEQMSSESSAAMSRFQQLCDDNAVLEKENEDQAETIENYRLHLSNIRKDMEKSISRAEEKRKKNILVFECREGLIGSVIIMGKKKLSKRAISDLVSDCQISQSLPMQKSKMPSEILLSSLPVNGNPVLGVNSSCHQACQTIPLQNITYENNNAAGSQEKNPAAIAPGTTCKEQPTNSSNSSQTEDKETLKYPKSWENWK
ncbi:uncharacterized protein Bfra_000211 [Botrytis fragariae]|uniref:Uncharacterized protein n=1 Tax=Botrytis fragariae TaxID=1964551 RepID=A0A8H6B2L1_9HELO|nr:uncharacterized protein Bfra_000211 [Botrytis fragariae]KAF5878044.1 hypothetical protein Bfra_000211 [Botrytis fragariae]